MKKHDPSNSVQISTINFHCQFALDNFEVKMKKVLNFSRSVRILEIMIMNLQREINGNQCISKGSHSPERIHLSLKVGLLRKERILFFMSSLTDS